MAKNLRLHFCPVVCSNGELSAQLPKRNRPVIRIKCNLFGQLIFSKLAQTGSYINDDLRILRFLTGSYLLKKKYIVANGAFHSAQNFGNFG